MKIIKILHVCLAAFYIDNYSYQENLLPKYHKIEGHEVKILASLKNFDRRGKSIFDQKEKTYTNEHGIEVTRISNKKINGIIPNIFRKLNIYNEKDIKLVLEEFKPDIVFIHGGQFFSNKSFREYKKSNNNVKLIVDNHADELNSARTWLSKNILHKILWKKMIKKIEPQVDKFYGVLPSRVEFLSKMYDVPNNKIELLVLGADDELIEETINNTNIKEIREECGIEERDLFIITGGKIDGNKPQVLTLMKVINEMQDENVKLIVFGTVSRELNDEFERQLSNKVKYIGWLTPEESYKYFYSSDLVVFPGLHSVFWEQVVGLGKACIFRYMRGFDHIDLGGNCIFFESDSTNEMKDKITFVLKNREKLQEMNRIAKEKGIDKFSYKKIAELSISNLENVVYKKQV